MSGAKRGLLNVGGEDWKEGPAAEHNVTFSIGSLIEKSMKLAEGPKPLTLEHAPIAKPADGRY
jgi:hypothetical protein